MSDIPAPDQAPVHEAYDEYDDCDIDNEDEEYDPGEDCGRWINGRLGQQCRLAGTEFCDWDCPYSR